MEYGLTAALIATVVVGLFVTFQTAFASQVPTRCYTLGTLLTPDKP